MTIIASSCPRPITIETTSDHDAGVVVTHADPPQHHHLHAAAKHPLALISSEPRDGARTLSNRATIAADSYAGREHLGPCPRNLHLIADTSFAMKHALTFLD